jgi:antibiotic biosynthesis monooxygenase (ABM) superfamily enzyme
MSQNRPSLPLLSRVRFAMLVMLGAYPLITGLLTLLGPLMDGWPIAARTLLIVPPMVSGMVFGVIPLVQRIGGTWIAAGAVRRETA